MRATVIKVDKYQNYSAKTENNILLVFSINGSAELELSEEIELDLQKILKTKVITRVLDGAELAIRIKFNDIHDLNLQMQHGGNRVPSKGRMSGI